MLNVKLSIVCSIKIKLFLLSSLACIDSTDSVTFPLPLSLPDTWKDNGKTVSLLLEEAPKLVKVTGTIKMGTGLIVNALVH